MEHVNVLIIGAGLSGIGAACHLKMKNPGKSFVLLEGRERIGGTWDLFKYPGVRSDSDMFTFGYSFKPWVEEDDIATAEAILNYLHETIDEYQLSPHIRFNRRVEAVRWSSPEQRWVAEVHDKETGDVTHVSSDVLLTCTGYYNYAHGHMPDFPGIEDFEGTIAQPQHWPEDLDYRGKRVVVIGSGATAVTVVPAMAKEAAHVTMLQRSPTYIFSRPAKDAISQALYKVFPDAIAFKLARVKAVALQWYLFHNARVRPQAVREYILNMAREEAGPGVDVDVHFNPKYEPWDQRLCLIPDGDLYASLASGEATIVTDTIETFTQTGIELTSGEHLDADIVVPATGLELQFLGGATMEVDGKELTSEELVCYRGMMFGDVPNWVALFGYTNASWTLKTDLTSEFVSRMLTHMDEHDYGTFVPRIPTSGLETQSILTNLSDAGYVQRGAARLPRQGTESPWRNKDNYVMDYLSIKFGKMDDGILQFGKKRNTVKQPANARGDAFSFKGKRAVVTGAASGIGRALAFDLAARGCHLALLDVQVKDLEEVGRKARAMGVEVSTHVVDMGDADQITAFATEDLFAHHPHVDLLINNAGVALGGNFEDASSEDFEWLMNINFYGVVNMTRALLEHLKQRPIAHIANVSSVFGMIAPPGQSAYVASKFAVRGFSEVLRHELADTQVGVSVIHPGGIKTKIARNARLAKGVLESDKARQAGDEVKKMEQSFITTPETASKTILEGIAARRPRIMVGPDARFIEVLERVFPVSNIRVLGRLLGRS